MSRPTADEGGERAGPRGRFRTAAERDAEGRPRIEVMPLGKEQLKALAASRDRARARRKRGSGSSEGGAR